MSWIEEVETYHRITPGQLSGCLPACKDPAQWAQFFDRAILRFDIQDVAMLMAQVGHESSDLNRLEESLYYTPERLMKVWPKRFPSLAIAKRFARNPEALANEVYGKRMGNYKPGDGWKYHGRGPIQITGRANYTDFAKASKLDCVENPDILLGKEGGALSACWFFSRYVPDGADINAATRAINGGLNGIEDRRKRYERCKEVMG